MKIPQPLENLLEMGAIEDVIRPLMSGKEAQVFMVRYERELCVAKVYKEAMQRSFRQRTVYAEGRKSKNSRDRRALERLGRYGRELQEENWKNAEVDMLYRLYQAGVRVPRPRDYQDGVLIMDMVKDANASPAPRLAEVEFTPEQATAVLQFLLRQIVIMLCAGVVHGDLSEYNILLAADGPVIIDFPQSVNASVNQNSRNLFIRDVQNIVNFLSTFNPMLKNSRYPQEIWELFEKSKLRPDTPLTGHWKDTRQNANVPSILREIENARLDHLRKQKLQS